MMALESIEELCAVQRGAVDEVVGGPRTPRRFMVGWYEEFNLWGNEKHYRFAWSFGWWRG